MPNLSSVFLSKKISTVCKKWEKTPFSLYTHVNLIKQPILKTYFIYQDSICDFF